MCTWSAVWAQNYRYPKTASSSKNADAVFMVWLGLDTHTKKHLIRIGNRSSSPSSVFTIKALQRYPSCWKCPSLSWKYIQWLKYHVEPWSLAWRPPRNHHALHLLTWKSAHIQVNFGVAWQLLWTCWYNKFGLYKSECMLIVSVICRNVKCQHIVPLAGLQVQDIYNETNYDWTKLIYSSVLSALSKS